MPSSLAKTMQSAAFGVMAALGLATSLCVAATWDGGGADDNWSTANNWDPNAVQPFLTTYTPIDFAASVSRTILNNDYGAATYVSRFTFPAGAPTFTVTGNQITLGSSPVIVNNSTASQSFSLPMHMFSPLSLSGTAGSGRVTLGGAITGAGTDRYFDVTNGGDVMLTGSNAYGGETWVRTGGTLTLSSTGSINSSSTIQIIGGRLNVDSSVAVSRTVQNFGSSTGGTLGGTGSITGAITVTAGNFLAPGNLLGALKTGALTMNDGSTFQYVAVDGSPTGASLLAANGALSLTNVTLDVSQANLAGGSWTVGDKLTLMSYVNSTGGITSGFVYNSTPWTDDTARAFGSNSWRLNYNDTGAGANYAGDLTGTRRVTLEVVAVPEPACLMGLLAIGPFLALRRTKRPR